MFAEFSFTVIISVLKPSVSADAANPNWYVPLNKNNEKLFLQS
jgi:hypothetical protein